LDFFSVSQELIQLAKKCNILYVPESDHSTVSVVIKYSKQKAKKYPDEEKSLHKTVNDLQARAEINPHNRNIILELQHARSCLKKIMLTKTKGAILRRSKVRWYEEGERNTK